METLFPGAFQEVIRARAPANPARFVNTTMLMDSSDSTAPNIISDSLSDTADTVGTTAQFVGALIILVLGVAAALAVYRITSEMETSIVTVWATMVGGWSIGWINATWIGAVAATAALTLGYIMWLKRS